MPQEDYSKAVASILAMSYQQRLGLLSVLADSLQDKTPAPKRITVSSREELHQKLQEGLKSIEEGRTYSTEEVTAYLNHMMSNHSAQRKSGTFQRENTVYFTR